VVGKGSRVKRSRIDQPQVDAKLLVSIRMKNAANDASSKENSAISMWSRCTL